MPFVTYLVSLRPGVDYWDTGEMQTVPYILGIAHPSGFPGYTLLGWLYAHAFPLGSVAWRMNLLSAIAMTATCWFVYRILIERDVEPEIAAGAALLFAFTSVAWGHATRADVHPVELAFGTAALYALMRWDRTLATRDLAWSAFAFAAALCVHSGAVLLFPGLFVIAFRTIERIRRRGWLAILIAVLCVPLVYAYLPLRSSIVTAQQRDPTVALGVPLGRPFWDFNHPATLEGLRAEITGSEFNAHLALRSIVDPRVFAQLPERFGLRAVRDFPYALIFLSLIGIAGAWRAPSIGAGLVLYGGVALTFVLGYAAESDVERYYLPAYAIVAIGIGLGASQLARFGAARARGWSFAAVIGVLLLVAASDLATHGGFFGQRTYREPAAFVARVKALTPRNAILVVTWVYATPLAYTAYVEHALDDRIVLTGWYDDYAARYRGWLEKRPVILIAEGQPFLPGLRLVAQDAREPTIYRVLR